MPWRVLKFRDFSWKALETEAVREFWEDWRVTLSWNIPEIFYWNVVEVLECLETCLNFVNGLKMSSSLQDECDLVFAEYCTVTHIWIFSLWFKLFTESQLFDELYYKLLAIVQVKCCEISIKSLHNCFCKAQSNYLLPWWFLKPVFLITRVKPPNKSFAFRSCTDDCN